MRQLSAPPDSLSLDGGVAFGSFRGGLPPLVFPPTGHGWLWNRAHEKRWTYAALADRRVFVGVAIVRLGYATNVLAFVFDRERSEMLADRSIIGPASFATFVDDGPGCRSARFAMQKARLEVGDSGISIDLPAHRGRRPVHVVASFEPARAPAIAAVVPIEGGFASATEKRIVTAHGEVFAEGRRISVEDGFGALDHTAGFLARHTMWRWALGLGRATTGESVGFNIVEGFVGEAECAAFVEGELHPLGEGRFVFSADQPLEPWRLTTTCGALDLTFDPGAVHAEKKNLGVVRSRFIQPVGAFSGRLRVGGKELALSHVPGVTEDQDVVW